MEYHCARDVLALWVEVAGFCLLGFDTVVPAHRRDQEVLKSEK